MTTQNSKPRVGTRLKVVKLDRLTPKQLQLLGQLLVYFFGRRLHALKKMRRNPTWVEPIPLTKLYEQFKCNARDREVVKVAAAVFFKNEFRGCYKTGKCSGWTALQEPHLNEAVKKLLSIMYKDNVEHMQAIRSFMNTSGEHQVEITTTFTFKDASQAETFKELMTQLDIPNEEPTT